MATTMAPAWVATRPADGWQSLFNGRDLPGGMVRGRPAGQGRAWRRVRRVLQGVVAFVVSPCLVTALAIGGDRDSLADVFAMEGRNILTAPEHLGIINGRLTVGTPGGQAARLEGLWAPAFVSSDFRLRLEVRGKEVPTPSFTWWPGKIEQRGEADGVQVSTAVRLIPGRRAGLVTTTLQNVTASPIEVPLVLRTGGTLDRCELWEFAQPRSSSPTEPRIDEGSLVLAAGDRGLVLRASGDVVTWDAASLSGTRRLALQAGGADTLHLAFAIGPAAEALASCKAIAAEPAKAIADADAELDRRVADLFRRVPRFESDDREIEKFYRRSLVHLLLNRWDVPEFRLQPSYTTGSIRGGCVTHYLWNHGEAWQLLPLYDPEAQREHIRQFLEGDMTSHFAFNPVDGQAHGPWYMVNQEKIVGLVYHYVRMTGDTVFLEQAVKGATVLEHVLKNAMHGDNTAQRVGLIDYGPSNSHLELRRQYAYNHVMPDLNGRRHANYLRAARLAEIAGKPAPHLRERAAALKALLKEQLWNPKTQWFDFINAKGQPETRWTVQMFYLLGGGVLDAETEAGLIGHFNDREFLGPYGLHSLAQGDPAYDPADVDNGGPGACTSFPPNIAFLLCEAGYPREAGDLLRRCVWWGSRLPYWGDSMCADRLDYRRDTPLQCTLDGVAVAQFFLFGLFGIDPQFDGRVLVCPRPTGLVRRAALRGVRIRGVAFDVEIEDQGFKVVAGGATVDAPMGRAISVEKKGTRTEAEVIPP